MKSGMFRIYLFLKDETGDDYIGKIKFMCSPAEFSSFAGDLRDEGADIFLDYLSDQSKSMSVLYRTQIS